MNAESIVKLSALIDKVGIDLASIKGEDKEEVGLQLVSQIMKNLYKAENEVYELISAYKNVSIEDAKKEDVIKIIKELAKIEGFKSFLVQS